MITEMYTNKSFTNLEKNNILLRNKKMFDVHEYFEQRNLSNQGKNMYLMKNGCPTCIVEHFFEGYITIETIRKVLEKEWGRLKSMRLFTVEGVQIGREDLKYLKKGDRIYFSQGEEFDSQRNFGQYKILKPLGEGGFAEVKLARNIITGEHVALKVVKPGKWQTVKEMDMAFQEVENLKNLHHPNIVRILNCFPQASMQVIIVMEYIEGPELHTILKQKKQFTEGQANHYFKQIAKAIAYCHRRGTIHRDLKLENILVTKNDEIKIVDFGISGMNHRYNPDIYWGTLKYMAPEVLSGKQKNNSTSVDAWACGIMLYFMLVGHLPFSGASSSIIIQDITSSPLTFPSSVNLSSGVKDLIRNLLQKNPEERMTIGEAEDHPWVKGKIEQLRVNHSEELLIKTSGHHRKQPRKSNWQKPFETKFPRKKEEVHQIIQQIKNRPPACSVQKLQKPNRSAQKFFPKVKHRNPKQSKSNYMPSSLLEEFRAQLEHR